MRLSRIAEPRLPRALWLRGYWPDRNPLRRAADRAEAAIVAAALVLFLAGAPLLALFAWHWANAAAVRVQHRQQNSWHRVSAVLLASARPVVDIGYGGVPGSEVPARWTAPDGAARTGDVPAPASARAGSTLRIWVDESGAQTGPPLRAQQATGQAAMASVLAPFALGTVLICAVSLAVYILDRRRLAAWAADWRATGPRWNSHR
jgi:sensor c-di-GMP phosphodiesterase-like protein